MEFHALVTEFCEILSLPFQTKKLGMLTFQSHYIRELYNKNPKTSARQGASPELLVRGVKEILKSYRLPQLLLVAS